jgi:hypothetical protein
VNILGRATGSLTLLLVAAAAVSTYKSTAAFQMGYRGVGMEVIDSKEHLAEKVKANELPPTLPPASTTDNSRSTPTRTCRFWVISPRAKSPD